MGRRMIDDDLIDGLERTDRAPYEPGTSPDSELADAVISAFLEKVEEERSKYIPSFVRASSSVYNTLVSLLGEEEELDEHAFLDILSLRYSQEESTALRYADCLFSPVLQVLYSVKGCNNFDLDLSSYNVKLVDLFVLIEGTEEKLLRCAFKGSSISVGTGAKYCDITVHAHTSWIGDGAENSKFTFSSALQFGQNARNCEFYLTKEYSRSQLYTFVGPGFFERGNSLLMTDGEGGFQQYSKRDLLPPPK